jgi:hypothetical protein
MSKAKSTVKKALRAKPRRFMATELAYGRARAVAARVESQRVRLFGVIGIVGCAREALGDEVAGPAPDIQAALDLARSILDQIGGELDPTHFSVSP